jgi:hypothetical protein
MGVLEKFCKSNDLVCSKTANKRDPAFYVVWTMKGEPLC